MPNLFVPGASYNLDNILTTNAMNVDLNMNGGNIVNCADPVAAQDVATKNYVDMSGGGGANVNLSNLVAPVSVNQTLIVQAGLGVRSEATNGFQILDDVTNPPGSNTVAFRSRNQTAGGTDSVGVLIAVGNNQTGGVLNTGEITVRSGDITNLAGNDGNTGIAVFRSGNISIATATGNTGIAQLRSGNNVGLGGTGDSELLSGNLTNALATGNTGSIYIRTGSNAGSGDTGTVEIQSGLNTGTGNSGDVNFVIGAATGGGLNGKVRVFGQFVLDKQAADPSNPEAGEIYFNTTTGKFRGFDGAVWVDLN